MELTRWLMRPYNERKINKSNQLLREIKVIVSNDE